MTSSLILNQSGFVLANARVLAAASQAAYHYEADAMADNSPGSEIPCQLAPQAPECARLGRESPPAVERQNHPNFPISLASQPDCGTEEPPPPSNLATGRTACAQRTSNLGH